MAPWVTVGLSYSTSASIQPIGGCTLLNPNMENKKTTTANFIKVY